MESSRFVDSNGVTVSNEGAIFPICNVEAGRLNFIGTGFFITDIGMFATAKHVLENEPGPLFIYEFIENNRYRRRNITRVSLSNRSDFAIGIVQQATYTKTGEEVKNKMLLLSEHIPSEGEQLSTYAYPETIMQHKESLTNAHFAPNWYHGKVIDSYPDGAGFIKSPAIVAEMQSLGGCSGGPVFSKNGCGGVVGINSRGIEDQVNFVSLTSALLSVQFSDVDVKGRHYDWISIAELIHEGFVKVVDIPLIKEPSTISL